MACIVKDIIRSDDIGVAEILRIGNPSLKLGMVNVEAGIDNGDIHHGRSDSYIPALFGMDRLHILLANIKHIVRGECASSDKIGTDPSDPRSTFQPCKRVSQHFFILDLKDRNWPELEKLTDFEALKSSRSDRTERLSIPKFHYDFIGNAFKFTQAGFPCLSLTLDRLCLNFLKPDCGRVKND